MYKLIPCTVGKKHASDNNFFIFFVVFGFVKNNKKRLYQERYLPEVLGISSVTCSEEVHDEYSQRLHVPFLKIQVLRFIQDT